MSCSDCAGADPDASIAVLQSYQASPHNILPVMPNVLALFQVSILGAIAENAALCDLMHDLLRYRSTRLHHRYCSQ